MNPLLEWTQKHEDLCTFRKYYINNYIISLIFAETNCFINIDLNFLGGMLYLEFQRKENNPQLFLLHIPWLKL